MAKRTEAQADTAIALALVALVASSALLKASVDTLTVTILSGFVLALFVYASRRHRLPVPGLARVFLFFGACSALQTIPIPRAMGLTLAPRSVDVWLAAVHLTGGTESTWLPTSMDPGASLVDALKWSSYAMVLTLSREVGSRRGIGWAAAGTLATGAVVAAITVVHGLVSAERLYGVVTVGLQVQRWRLGPILNPNNLAGYMNLAVLCGLGVMMKATPNVRILLIPSLVLVMAVSFLAGSQGGMIAFAFGIILLALLLQLGNQWGRTSPNALGITLALGLCVALVGADSVFWGELTGGVSQKLSLQLDSLSLIRDHLYSGVGRGAFETVSGRYRSSSGNFVFQYAENFLIDWAAGWGIPVTLVGLVCAASSFPRINRRKPEQLAVWAGVVTLLFQNLADLATELFAFGIVISFLLGALLGSNSPKCSRPSQPRRVQDYVPNALLAAAALAVLCGVARSPGGTASDDRRDLGALTARARTRQDYIATFDRIRSAFLRHPSDGYLARLGGTMLGAAGRPGAIRWLSQSLLLDPLNGQTHIAVADALGRATISQRLLHLKLAIDMDASLISPAATRAARWAHPAEIAEELPDRRELAVLYLLGIRDGSVSALKDRESLMQLARQIDEHNPNLLLSEARDLVARAQGQGVKVDANDVEKCELAISAIEKAHPFESLILKAKLFLARGEANSAETLLRRACAQPGAGEPCLRLRVEAAAGTQENRLREASAEYRMHACPDDRECTEIVKWLAGVAMGGAHWGLARQHLAEIAERQQTASSWLAVAAAARRSGAIDMGVRAIERARKFPDALEPDLANRIRLEEASLSREKLPE